MTNTAETQERIKKSKGSQLFNVPNDEDGKEAIQSIRKYLNKKDYKAILRGRGPRQGNFNYRYDLPLDESDYIAVYVKFSDDRLNRMVNSRTKYLQGELDTVVKNRDYYLMEYSTWKEKYYQIHEGFQAYRKDARLEMAENKRLREEIEKLKRTPIYHIKSFLDKLWKFLNFNIHVSVKRGK